MQRWEANYLFSKEIWIFSLSFPSSFDITFSHVLMYIAKSQTIFRVLPLGILFPPFSFHQTYFHSLQDISRLQIVFNLLQSKLNHKTFCYMGQDGNKNVSVKRCNTHIPSLRLSNRFNSDMLACHPAICQMTFMLKSSLCFAILFPIEEIDL